MILHLGWCLISTQIVLLFISSFVNSLVSILPLKGEIKLPYNTKWSCFFLSLLTDYKKECTSATPIATKEKNLSNCLFQRSQKAKGWLTVDSWAQPLGEYSGLSEAQKVFEKRKTSAVVDSLWLLDFLCNSAWLNCVIPILENYLNSWLINNVLSGNLGFPMLHDMFIDILSILSTGICLPLS